MPQNHNVQADLISRNQGDPTMIVAAPLDEYRFAADATAEDIDTRLSALESYIPDFYSDIREIIDDLRAYTASQAQQLENAYILLGAFSQGLKVAVHQRDMMQDERDALQQQKDVVDQHIKQIREAIKAGKADHPAIQQEFGFALGELESETLDAAHALAADSFAGIIMDVTGFDYERAFNLAKAINSSEAADIFDSDPQIQADFYRLLNNFTQHLSKQTR